MAYSDQFTHAPVRDERRSLRIHPICFYFAARMTKVSLISKRVHEFERARQDYAQSFRSSGLWRLFEPMAFSPEIAYVLVQWSVASRENVLCDSQEHFG